MDSVLNKPDIKLTEKIQRSDPTAFKKLFEKYWEDLYRKAYHRLQDQALAEDMVQDVFADLWAQRTRLNIHRGIANYLYSVLKYKIIHWASQHDRQQQMQAHLLERMEEIEDTILGVLEAGSIKKTISEVIDTFPANMRQIFLLRTEDYSVGEIAAALQLAEQTIKNNHTEALKRLKIKLLDEYPHLPIYSLITILFTKS